MLENDSSVTGQKVIKVELIDDQITFKDIKDFSIDLNNSSLSIGKLYKALFNDIESQVQITLIPSDAIQQNKKAKSIFNSLKSIVDTAVEEINSEIPSVLEEKVRLEDQLESN